MRVMRPFPVDGVIECRALVSVFRRRRECGAAPSHSAHTHHKPNTFFFTHMNNPQPALHAALADTFTGSGRAPPGLDKLISEAGRDGVNKTNRAGQTPLHIAARGGMPSAVQDLIKAGANPSLPNANGDLAEDVAARHNNYECAAILRRSREQGTGEVA